MKEFLYKIPSVHRKEDKIVSKYRISVKSSLQVLSNVQYKYPGKKNYCLLYT